MEKKGNSIIHKSNSLISMWFMLHEISNHKVSKVKNFLKTLHKISLIAIFSLEK